MTVGGFPSLTRLGMFIGITSGSMSHLFRGKNNPDDETVRKLCEVAGEPFDEWLIRAHAARNDGKIAETWLSILDRLQLNDGSQKNDKAA